ncbi:CDGSH iron-sulfur domain-containing protein [Arthrobacter glacialis]|uniref:Iron-binding zinc finger CDGSH type domain-containing protein n=1 Tax=Arthrobacter glacialis TaxID=1664 RepID=A0A2S3ZTX1_ARTGL|nr:CDGSH iron-sulfur domain-containing protein [Arthrobacter glacialis]POH72422.1 hypothetical protein CVS27_16200 [Arthrobacter glacialis]
MSSQQRSSPSITACPDGLLLIRGDIELLTGTGDEITRKRKTIALCRCGASTIKPHCDGTHKLINFTTDNPQEPAAKPTEKSTTGSSTTDLQETVSDELGTERRTPSS